MAGDCGPRFTPVARSSVDQRGATLKRATLKPTPKSHRRSRKVTCRFSPFEGGNFGINLIAMLGSRANLVSLSLSRTRTMTLREGVTFSDGTPFDAAAVKANFERATTVEGSGVKAYLASVASRSRSSIPTHVRFVLSRPDATLPNQLGHTPRHAAQPRPPSRTPTSTPTPVGTGPYVLREYRRW